ncbi:MAG: hypothetical protein H7833_07125 [Magnetococcus sp. DMHC-1]|nr:hypothetical protein [Magnetococcales bacterium]
MNQQERLDSRMGEEGHHSTSNGSLKQLSLETVLTDADVRRLLRILSVR